MGAELIGFGTTSALISAALAGLTVFLLLSPPPRRPASGALNHPPGRVERLWRGRSDAAPLRRRASIAGFGGAALGVLVHRFLLPNASTWSLVLLALAVAAGLTLALAWLEPASTRRRRQCLVLQTPQALELLAGCLAVGMPVRTALSAVVAAFDAPIADDLGRLKALTDLGVSDAEAWKTLSEHPQLGPAAADLARSVESGTLLVDGLRHHAAQARDQRQAALQVVARSVGVRSVLPLMGCFIPAFVLIGVVPTVASALTHAFTL